MLDPLEPERRGKEEYFCKRCAAKVEKGNKFCGRCGVPLIWREPYKRPKEEHPPGYDSYKNQTPLGRARLYFMYSLDQILDAWLAYRDKVVFYKGLYPEMGKKEFIGFLRKTPIIERVEEKGENIVAYLKSHEGVAFEDVPPEMKNK